MSQNLDVLEELFILLEQGQHDLLDLAEIIVNIVIDQQVGSILSKKEVGSSEGQFEVELQRFRELLKQNGIVTDLDDQALYERVIHPFVNTIAKKNSGLC